MERHKYDQREMVSSQPHSLLSEFIISMSLLQKKKRMLLLAQMHTSACPKCALGLQQAAALGKVSSSQSM